MRLDADALSKHNVKVPDRSLRPLETNAVVDLHVSEDGKQLQFEFAGQKWDDDAPLRDRHTVPLEPPPEPKPPVRREPVQPQQRQEALEPVPRTLPLPAQLDCNGKTAGERARQASELKRQQAIDAALERGDGGPRSSS